MSRPKSVKPSLRRADADAPTHARAPCILVIEDDPSARDTFARLLAAEGYRVALAGDAHSAMAQIRRATPDGILIDLHLPLESGLDFLRDLRADKAYRPIPVAIVTADYFLEDTTSEELRALGAHIHFKPVWEEDLLRIARELVAPERP